MENTLKGRGEVWSSLVEYEVGKPSGESDGGGDSLLAVGGSGTTDESLSWNFGGGWIIFSLISSRVMSEATCVCVGRVVHVHVVVHVIVCVCVCVCVCETDVCM